MIGILIVGCLALAQTKHQKAAGPGTEPAQICHRSGSDQGCVRPKVSYCLGSRFAEGVVEERGS